MENRNIITTSHYTLREALVDSDGDTQWEVTDPKNGNTFIIHVEKNGHMYISFFNGDYISSECSYRAIRKVCEILLERGFKPTIDIHYTNKTLIITCRKIGFRKFKNIKHLYYLNTLK